MNIELSHFQLQLLMSLIARQSNIHLLMNAFEVPTKPWRAIDIFMWNQSVSPRNQGMLSTNLRARPRWASKCVYYDTRLGGHWTSPFENQGGRWSSCTEPELPLHQTSDISLEKHMTSDIQGSYNTAVL